MFHVFGISLAGTQKDKVLESVLGAAFTSTNIHTSRFVTIYWGGCDRKSISVAVESYSNLEKILCVSFLQYFFLLEGSNVVNSSFQQN